MTTSLQEMRSGVIRYLSSQDTLEEFHEWFTAAAVELGREGDPEITGFVDAVDGLFIQLSEQELTDTEFDERLRGLLPSVRVMAFEARVDEGKGFITYQPDAGTTALQPNVTREEVSA